MPKEITEESEFVEIAKTRASSCRIKRVGDVVKLKLRTPGHLYTFKTTADKAESLLKSLEIEQIEI